MADGPRFRPDRGAQRGVPWSMVAILALVGAVLVARALWPAPGGVDPLITVQGDVPNPGTYVVAEARVHAALEAAGADPSRFEDQPVPHGFRVVVSGDEVSIHRPEDPVLVRVPIDPNTATVAELDAIPGISHRTAERLVNDRRAHGPFRTLEAMRRVVSSETIDRLEPFVELGPVPLLDLNSASAGELEGLPGIGPVLAARIVVDRAEHGPYGAIAELERVQGVGPALITRIADQVEAR